MSWDVYMVRTKTNSEKIDEIADEDIVPFTCSEIIDEMKKIAAELGADYDCEHPSWQLLETDEWSIEIGIDEDKDTACVMLCVRGGEPKAVFERLITDLNTRLIDCGTGDFFTPDMTTTFGEWKAFRDQVVAEISSRGGRKATFREMLRHFFRGRFFRRK